jgi:hypothetical protein
VFPPSNLHEQLFDILYKPIESTTLASRSNSQSIDASIFESLWTQTDLYKKS